MMDAEEARQALSVFHGIQSGEKYTVKNFRDLKSFVEKRLGRDLDIVEFDELLVDTMRQVDQELLYIERGQ